MTAAGRDVPAALAVLRATVAGLRAKLPVTAEELEGDELLEWTAARGLSLAADAVVDAGARLLGRDAAAAAAAPAAMLGDLAASGVLWPETAERLRALPGLRDALVPDDVVLDRVRLLDALTRLEAFDRFADEVEAWLGRRAQH